MKIIKPPDDILERLVFHCEANDIAMAMIGSDEAGVCMILMGRRGFSPDQASIIAADMLLQGVISGGFIQENIKKTEEDNTPIPKDKVM